MQYLNQSPSDEVWDTEFSKVAIIATSEIMYHIQSFYNLVSKNFSSFIKKHFYKLQIITK